MPGRSAGPRSAYSAWSAWMTAASTSDPSACGVKPSAVSSSSEYIGSCTVTGAPRSRRARTVSNTPLNAVSFTPPR